MRRIAIVGAGQAGLQLGFGLLRHGYEVSIHTDRAPEEVFNGRLLSTATLFETALRHEEELGLDFWADRMPRCDGVHTDVSVDSGTVLLSAAGRFAGSAGAVDQRLKYYGWANEFVRRGGRFDVTPVSRATVESLAAESDLVCIAAGRNGVADVFRFDSRRSAFSRPPRRLSALLLNGVEQDVGLARPGRFTVLPGIGEIFWFPFLDKAREECHSICFEAVPGGPMDRFGSVRSGIEALETARIVIDQLLPWERETFRRVSLADEDAWLTGAFTPIIREPAGELPSGRPVLGLGDAIALYDPIVAQGGNCASKMAHHLTERIVEHRRRRFDREWMEGQFEDFWRETARHMAEFSRVMMEPGGTAVQELILAASRSRAVADEFLSAFDDPARSARWLEDVSGARSVIAERTGKAWLRTAIPARLQVAARWAAGRLGLMGGRKALPIYGGESTG